MDGMREVFETMNIDELFNIYEYLKEKYEMKGIFNKQSSIDFIKIISKNIFFEDTHFDHTNDLLD